MTAVLLAPVTPACAARLSPLAAAAADEGLAVRWAWFGSANEREAAEALGLPTEAGTGFDALSSNCAFVAVAGHDERTLATAETAVAFGARLVRVDAGARAFADDRFAAAVDRAAHVLLCATTHQRENLRREGLPLHATHVAGCGLAHAAAAWTRPRGARVALFVDGPDAAEIAQALLPIATARDLELSPANALQDLAGARAVVTDRDDAQVAAAALAIPCVTAAYVTARPETVDRGANQIAGRSPRALARALAIALDGPRPDSNVGANAPDAKILRVAFAAAPAAPAAELALPGDADASGRELGAEECEVVARAIRSGTLNSTRGTFVTAFERAFAAHAQKRFAIACASGSAAVHVAIAALGLRPGDEVVTTPITDMGALTCICYEGGVPVFADVDPRTLNVTADTLRAQITDRTRALVVTHLFGRVCDMAPVLRLAEERGLPVIEDCAQAFGAFDRAGRAGSFGSIACWSLQQGKHMTTGEGGVVTTDDEALARRMFLFVNKAWGYGDPKPDHYFPALNYRMTELQGAVAQPQLRKLDWVVARRREAAARLTRSLQGVHGLELPGDPDGGVHSYWKYAVMVDPVALPGGASALAARIRQRGVSCIPHYVQKPAFECALFLDFDRSPVTRLPLEHNPRRNQPQPLYVRKDYPGAVQALERVLVLPINERWEERHTDAVAAAIREAAEGLARG